MNLLEYMKKHPEPSLETFTFAVLHTIPTLERIKKEIDKEELTEFINQLVECVSLLPQGALPSDYPIDENTRTYLEAALTNMSIICIIQTIQDNIELLRNLLKIQMPVIPTRAASPSTSENSERNPKP